MDILRMFAPLHTSKEVEQKPGVTGKQASAVQPAQQAQTTTAIPQPVPQAYYVDTISKADDELPTIIAVIPAASQRRRLESHREVLSAQLDAELAKETKNFDKLQSLVYTVIQALMREAAKHDKERAFEINLQVMTKAHEIKGTYNTWQGLSITVFSSGVNIFAGAAGLSGFLPVSVVAAESAKMLVNAATPVSYAGQGIGGLGGIFDKREEAKRHVMQITEKDLQDKQDESKGANHSKSDLLKSAKAALEEYHRLMHEAHRSTLG